LEEFRPGRPPLTGQEEHISEELAPTETLRSEQITPTPPADRPPRAVDLPREFGIPGARKGLAGSAVYWLTVLLLTPVACVAAAIYLGSWREPQVGLGLAFVVFLGLPAVQLAASAASAVVVLRLPPKQREASLRAIGKITLYTVVGTLFGLLMMAPCLLELFK
jgi:hypothetical protein